MINNPGRASARDRESLSVFVASAGWIALLAAAEKDIIRPLRAKALGNAELDPREQTGVVRSLQAVRKLIELPYTKLAEASEKKLEEVMPKEVQRLFS